MTPERLCQLTRIVCDGEQPQFPLFAHAAASLLMCNLHTVVVNPKGDVFAFDEPVPIEQARADIYLLSYYGVHFEWLAPRDIWLASIRAAITERGTVNTVDDPTADEVRCLLGSAQQCKRAQSREESVRVSQHSHSEVYDALVEELRRKKARSLLADISVAGSSVSTRASRSAAEQMLLHRRKRLIVEAFSAQGVLSKSSEANPNVVFTAVNNFCSREKVSIFADRYSLGGFLSSVLAEQQLPITFQPDRQRCGGFQSRTTCSTWNINLQALWSMLNVHGEDTVIDTTL